MPDTYAFDVGGLQRGTEAARDLPPHDDGPWLTSETPLDQGDIMLFKQYDVIQKVDRVQDKSTRRFRWQTSPGVHDWLDTYASEPQCPHENGTGIHTIEPGQTYTCTNPECDCRFDRARAEEVLA